MKFKESNYSHLRQVMRLLFFGGLILVVSNFVNSRLSAQGAYGMPLELAKTDSGDFRPIPISEIYSNFNDLMVNPDTNLNKAKKRAQRWMAYTMPYLSRSSDGYLTNQPFNDALKAIYTSPLQCSDSDPADWISDGPSEMPAWSWSGTKQQFSGWIDAVYNNPLALNEYLAGTRTSGIMRTTDGGVSWNCVTDDLSFPVLGLRQFLADPNDPDRILAITGTEFIEGSLIISSDGGENWSQADPNLPEFFWMSYHPTIDDLVFAVSKYDVYVSFDNGTTFQYLDTPPQHPDLSTSHQTMHQIFVLEDQFYCSSLFEYDAPCLLYKCSITVDQSAETISTTWTSEAEDEFTNLTEDDQLSHVWFSNLALGRFYVYIGSNQKIYDDGEVIGYEESVEKKLYKSTDSGGSYSEISGYVVGNIRNNKCELIASENDPNIYYTAQIFEVIKVNDITSATTVIDGISDELTGHHNDYRSSHILNDNGMDKIVFGNDGGVGLVEDGLATSPTIRTLNGDLSVNLIHAFNVHEETGRTVFGFQDHSMIYRESNGNYSNVFLFEGAFAMIQQHYPDAIVGANKFIIRDKPGSSNHIVNPNIGGFYLGGYQYLSRYDPTRFIAGLSGGKIGINKGVNISERLDIPPFQNQGDNADRDYTVGAVAMCQRNPTTIYAARWNDDNNGTQNVLAKSVDDGITWSNLSLNTVTNNNGSTQTLTSLAIWRRIRAIEVDHFDENLVYLGIGGTNTPGGIIVDEEKKVLKSTDGGATFTDWSEGLPALPVERLLTVESDNHLIFAATSVGIYYRHDGMSQWECFSEGLPKAQITGLQYDYCNNILYASTYGRGLWKTPVNIPFTNSYVETITDDETWDMDRTVYTDVVIEPGSELTVTSIIRMAPGTNFIVEPGAQLTLNGGTLTNACSDMWQGVEIHGNNTLAQTTENQGVLVTKNNATIANAREAIAFMEPGNWESRGGIAWCRETTFLNNKRSAAFYKYPSTDELETYDNIPDYKSHFIDCDFIFDNDNLLTESETTPFAQVTLWGVKGVKFLGCRFVNTEDVSQSDERSKGIFSIDASYYINDYCEVGVPVGGTCPTANLKKSSFTGYRYGVHPQGATGLYAPKIRDTDFEQNMVGIFFDVASHSEAIDNKFNVGNHPYDSPFPGADDATFHTGVLTMGLTDFVIEDNTFTGINTQSDFSHGAVVQEGEGAIVAVYNNEMINLGSGAIGAGINDDHLNVKNGGEYGLRFICNQNMGNSTDIEVRDIEGDDGFIDDTQTGWDNVGQAAGNTFSAPDGFNNNYVHLDFNSDKYYEYRYDDQDPAQIPHPDEMINSSPGTLADLQRVIATSANSCPSNYEPTAGGPDKYEYYSLKSNYYNLLYTYHQFIDQGNTEAVLNDIALTWPNDAWLLRDELVARSPNNSDTVLIAAADKNILPHGMLLEVLLLNPDGLRNGNVINHVKCCIADPMPQYMIDILLASRNVQTARTLVEQNLGNLRHKMAAEHRMIVSELLRDSLGVPNDTLVEWLGDMRHLKGRYQLVSHYLGVNDFAKARETMDSIQTQLSLKSAAIKELNKMRQFTTFLETIDGQGKNIAQLDSNQVEWLVNMANDREAGTAADRAENILCFFYGMCTPPPSVPKSNATAQRKPKPDAEELIRAQNKVSFSPNPADQYIQLEYDLLFAKEHTDMRVYDQLGRLITTYTIGMNTKGVEILDTRKLTPGVYIVEIVQNEKQVFSDKFIVQH